MADLSHDDVVTLLTEIRDSLRRIEKNTADAADAADYFKRQHEAGQRAQRQAMEMSRDFGKW